MPIAGVSDQLRFPRLGKIHLGIKAKNQGGKEYPKAVDYFVCNHPAFQAVYPGKPKALEIVFVTNDSEQWASQFYRAYAQTRGLVCKGDGMTARRLIDADTGETAIAGPQTKHVAWTEDPIECPGRDCSYYQGKQCRMMMMLQFMLPKVQGMGIWQLDTSSINSIININSSLALLRAFGVTDISGKPFTLRVVPQEVSPGGAKKTVYVLQLESAGSLEQLRGLTALPAPDEGEEAVELPEAEDEAPEMHYPPQEEIEAEVPTYPVLPPSPLADFQQAVIALAEHKASLGWAGEASDAQLAMLDKILNQNADLVVAVFERSTLSKAEAGAMLDQLTAVGKTHGAITALKEAAAATVGAPA